MTFANKFGGFATSSTRTCGSSLRGAASKGARAAVSLWSVFRNADQHFFSNFNLSYSSGVALVVETAYFFKGRQKK